MMKAFQRVSALAMAAALSANLALPVLAEGSPAPLMVTSPVDRAEISGDESWAEVYPNGLANFVSDNFSLNENDTAGTQVALVRQGGTAGEVTVELRALDLTARYGSDYTVTVYDAEGAKEGTAKADPDAVPMGETIEEGKVTAIGAASDETMDTVTDMVENDIDTVTELTTPDEEDSEITEQVTAAADRQAEAKSKPEVPDALEISAEISTAETAAEPTAAPTAEPTAAPTAEPTAAPTAEPTAAPTAEPTAAPTEEATAELAAAAAATAEAPATFIHTLSEWSLLNGMPLTPAEPADAGLSLQEAKSQATGIESDAVVWQNLSPEEQQAALQSANLIGDSTIKEALAALPAASATIAFAEGEYVKYIVVTPLDDTTPEADEEFYLMLANPTGGLVCGDMNYTLGTIVEDDAGETSAVTLENACLIENGGKAQVTLRREGGLHQYATVYVGTEDVTAADGSDYAGGTVQLLFTPGMTEQKVTVGLLSNPYRNTERSFNFKLVSDDETVAVAVDTLACTIPADPEAAADDDAISGELLAADANDEIGLEMYAADSQMTEGITGGAINEYGMGLPVGAFLVTPETDRSKLTEEQRNLVTLAEKQDTQSGYPTPQKVIYYLPTALETLETDKTKLTVTPTTDTFDGITVKGLAYKGFVEHQDAAVLPNIPATGFCTANIYTTSDGPWSFLYAVNDRYTSDKSRAGFGVSRFSYRSISDFENLSSGTNSAMFKVFRGETRKIYGLRIDYFTPSFAVGSYNQAGYADNLKTYRREVSVGTVNNKVTIKELKATEYQPGELSAQQGAKLDNLKPGESITFLPKYSDANPDGAYAKLGGVRLRYYQYYADIYLDPDPVTGAVTLPYDDSIFAVKELSGVLRNATMSGKPITVYPIYLPASPSVTLQAAPLYAQFKQLNSDSQTVTLNDDGVEGYVHSGDTIKGIEINARLQTETPVVTAQSGRLTDMQDATASLTHTGHKQGEKGTELYDYAVSEATKQIITASAKTPQSILKSNPRTYGVFATVPKLRMDGVTYDMAVAADREKYAAVSAKFAKENKDVKYGISFGFDYDTTVPAEMLQQNKDNYATPQKATFRVYREDGALRKAWSFDYKNGVFDSGVGWLLSGGWGDWNSQWSDYATVQITVMGKDGKTRTTQEVGIDFLVSNGAAALMQPSNAASNTVSAASRISVPAMLQTNNALQPYQYMAFALGNQVPVWGDKTPDTNGDGLVSPKELDDLAAKLHERGFKGDISSIWDEKAYIGTNFSLLPRLSDPTKVYYSFVNKQPENNPSPIFVKLFQSGATILNPKNTAKRTPVTGAEIYVMGEKMTPVADSIGGYTTGNNYEFRSNYYGTVMLGSGEGAYNFVFGATGSNTNTVIINPLEIMPATKLKMEEQQKSGAWQDAHLERTATYDIADKNTRISFRMDSSFTGVVPNRAYITIYDKAGNLKKTWTAESLGGVFSYIVNLQAAGVQPGDTMSIAGAVFDENGNQKAVFPAAPVGMVFAKQLSTFQLLTAYTINAKIDNHNEITDFIRRGVDASTFISGTGKSDTATHISFTDKAGRERTQTVYHFQASDNYAYQYAAATSAQASVSQRATGAESADWSKVLRGDEKNPIQSIFTLRDNADMTELAKSIRLFRTDKQNEKDEDKEKASKQATKKIALDIDLIVSAAYVIDDVGYELTKEDPDEPEFRKDGYKYFYSMALLAQVSFSARGSISIPTPIVIPVRLELDGKVAGGVVYSSQVPSAYSFNKAFKIDGDDMHNVQTHGTGHNVTYSRLSLSAALAVSAGVGWSQLKVMLTGKFNLVACGSTPKDPFGEKISSGALGGKFGAQMGITWKILCFGHYHKLMGNEWPFGDEGAQLVTVPTTPTGMDTMPQTTEADLQSREYLALRGDAAPATMTGGLQTLQNGVYPNGSMSLVSLGGGKQLLVYQDDDGSTPSAYNASALYARLYDGTSWLDPVKLDDDATWDEAPDAVLLGDGRVVVAWTDAREDLTAGALDAQLNKLRISGRIIASDGTAVGAPFEITKETDTTSLSDGSVQLAVTNDGGTEKLLAVYQKNDYEHLYTPSTPVLGYDGVDGGGYQNLTRAYNALAYRVGTISGNTVSFADDPADAAYYGQQFVATNIASKVTLNADGTKTATGDSVADAMLVEFDVADDKNGNPMLAYTLDADNDASTEGDRTLYLRAFDKATGTFGAPILVDAIASGVASPQLAPAGDTVNLYWLTSTGICSVDAAGVLNGSISTGPAGLLATGTHPDVNFVTHDNEKENPIVQFRATGDDKAAYVVWSRAIGDEVAGTAETVTYTDEEGEKTETLPNETLMARRIYTAKGTPQNGGITWTGSLPVTEAEGENFDAFSAATADGELTIAGIRHTETLALQEQLSEGVATLDNATPRQLVTFKVNKPAALADTAIDVAATDTLKAGDSTAVSLAMGNSGLELLECKYQYAVTKDGTDLAASEWSDMILPGGSAAALSGVLTMPEDLTGCSLTLRVQDKAGKLLDTATTPIEAAAVPMFGYEDIYLDGQGNAVVSARLSNIGTAPLSDTVHLTDDTLDGSTPELAAMAVNLPAGATQEITFTVPESSLTFVSSDQNETNGFVLNDGTLLGLRCGEADCEVPLERAYDENVAAALNSFRGVELKANDVPLRDGDTITLLLGSEEYTNITTAFDTGENDTELLDLEYELISGNDVLSVYGPDGLLLPQKVGAAQLRFTVVPATQEQFAYGTVDMDPTRLVAHDAYYPDNAPSYTLTVLVKEKPTDPDPTPQPTATPAPTAKPDEPSATPTAQPLVTPTPSIPATADAMPLTALWWLSFGSMMGLCLVLFRKRRR